MGTLSRGASAQGFRPSKRYIVFQLLPDMLLHDINFSDERAEATVASTNLDASIAAIRNMPRPAASMSRRLPNQADPTPIAIPCSGPNVC
jgi:hypothetical protein